MSISRTIALLTIFFVAMALSFFPGCDVGAKPSVTDGQAADSTSGKKVVSSESGADGTNADETAEHGHKGGEHGGIIVSLGQDSYHVEAVVASDGQIRLFTLGKDETRVIDVESQTLKGFVKADGDAEAQEIAFEPAPQDGDAANRTSLFTGKLPSSHVGKILDVTIPNIRIGGERFRLGFRTSQTSHTESAAMPDKVLSEAEKELYLTPGGHYTDADIAANGRVTASQKFKGIKSDHNMNTKPGTSFVQSLVPRQMPSLLGS